MSSESPSPPKLSLKKKLLFAAVSILLLLVVLEIGLTTFSYLFYPRLIVSDDDLGWIYTPTEGVIRRHDRGGQVNELAINNEGFRDDEFATDEDVLRIMFLGDSTTFGLESDQDEIYPVLVEQQLRKRLGTDKVDVMNFGITGFNNSQELACLRKYAPRFKPQAIVLQMSEWNDFDGNTWIYQGRYLPHILYNGGDYVEVNKPTGLYKFLSFLRDHSTLYYFLTQYVRDPLTVAQDLTPEQETELTLHIVGKIHDYAQERGIPFHVLYVRDPKDPTERYEAMRKMAEDQGIDLAMVLATPEKRVAGIGHWNAEGHREAADLVTQMLLADEVVGSRAAKPEPDEAAAVEN